MKITDELRAWAHGPDEGDDWLDRIDEFCDRIDEEHERVVRERRRSCVYYDPERHYCSCHDFDVSGYVELPKDADGEYIHVGDVMEGFDKHDSLKKVMGKVITVRFEADELVDVAVQAWNGDGKSWRRAYLDPDASVYRHHHEPTVEDVLSEFASKVCNSGHQWGLDAADTIAEYAARLQLAGDGE